MDTVLNQGIVWCRQEHKAQGIRTVALKCKQMALDSPVHFVDLIRHPIIFHVVVTTLKMKEFKLSVTVSLEGLCK